VTHISKVDKVTQCSIKVEPQPINKCRGGRFSQSLIDPFIAYQPGVEENVAVELLTIYFSLDCQIGSPVAFDDPLQLHACQLCHST